ncbi:MAG: helix-turn-helix transcriptional regulator [Bacteroidetes bacterium]|nr:helix-turn-helix transcriptional regulator [Bacteroidota bacterium]
MSDRVNVKIKEKRKKLGMTLQTLSSVTGLSKGYLSKIESSDFAPRIQTLNKIARALGTDIGYFLEEYKSEEKQSHNIDLVKRDQHPQKTGEHTSSGYSYISLLHNYTGKYMAPYILKIEQGCTEKFTHDSEEFIFLMKGSLIFSYDGREYELNEGDSVYFDSRLKHSLKNDQMKEAEILNVVYDYRKF